LVNFTTPHPRRVNFSLRNLCHGQDTVDQAGVLGIGAGHRL
jgi:hypothetical protein